MAVKRKQDKSIIVRLLVLCVSVYMIFTLVGLWGNLSEKRAELLKVKQKKNEMQLEVSDLQQLLNKGTESQIIEKAARERLGYVYSDEEVFLDISGN